MTETLNYEQWSAELARVMAKTGDDGMTAAEIAEAGGVNKTTALQKLKIAIEQGQMVVGRGFRTRMDGVDHPIPVYRFVKKGRK